MNGGKPATIVLCRSSVSGSWRHLRVQTFQLTFECVIQAGLDPQRLYHPDAHPVDQPANRIQGGDEKQEDGKTVSFANPLVATRNALPQKPLKSRMLVDDVSRQCRTRGEIDKPVFPNLKMQNPDKETTSTGEIWKGFEIPDVL